jgi:hypothetical protein
MNTLNDVFNLPVDTITASNTEILTTSGEVIVPAANTNDEAVQVDYENTRSNLYNLLHQGQDALMHALEIAKSSEHPRAFEVVGGLMKQLADVNHQLLDLSEKRQKLLDKSKESADPAKQVTNNNAIFVGSTTELNKMLQNMTRG